MGFNPTLLWKAPEINPINYKARSVPILNPVNMYGRVFFFSTFGFLIAFLSWYAFPPLTPKTLREDLHLSNINIANGNIVALTATLVIRIICGPLCDRFGPRYVFIGILLAGSIPTAMAGLVTNAKGLIALRFFVGILGASFVPCQVWSTGFYDKNVVGTANALMAGWGNAGGGITYFVMPAVFDSLVHDRGLTPHKAWRVAFIVPFILIFSIAMGMLFLCDDTPTGKWSERHINKSVPVERYSSGKIVDLPSSDLMTSSFPSAKSSDPELKKDDLTKSSDLDVEASTATITVVTIAEAEIIQPPTFREILRIATSLHSIQLMGPYFCSFGGELAINSILGSYYLKNFPKLGQTGSGRWASMFGLINVVTRPLGGIVSDIIYKYTGHSLWAKKAWLIFLGVAQGVFCIGLGLTNPHNQHTMFGLVAGLAIFMDAANGANFSLVPHVHPHANGVLSGFVGACGNLGGIMFALIFRYNGTHYDKVIWIIGVIMIAINLAVSWIRPLPKGQIGGRG